MKLTIYSILFTTIIGIDLCAKAYFIVDNSYDKVEINAEKKSEAEGKKGKELASTDFSDDLVSSFIFFIDHGSNLFGAIENTIRVPIPYHAEIPDPPPDDWS